LFSATLSNNANSNTLVVNSSKANSRSYLPIKNGIEISYSFSQYGFAVKLQLYLDNEGLICRIPLEGISENGDYSLLNMDVLPFFGASGAAEKGYILYPDGCGALYELGDTGGGVSSIISTEVYSKQILDIDQLLENRAKKVNGTPLPFFGTKRGEDSMVAYITEGDVSSTINLSPLGCIYRLNRIYATAVYRRVQETVNSSGTSFFDVEKEMRGVNFSVRYSFLAGEKSDYSDMAQSIRRYMVDTGRLKEQAEVAYSSYIEMLMGVQEKSLVSTKYVKTTSFDEASKMLEELLDESMKASVSLLGWSKEGYGVSPSTASPSGSIGGLGGLKKLSNNFADINLQYDTIIANSTATGGKIRRDAVSNLRRITIMDRDEKIYVMNPVTSYNFFNKSFDSLINLKCEGILLPNCANMLYDDYNKSGGITREQTATVFINMMNDIVGKNQKLVLEAANAYALPYASLLTKMPEASSGYSILKKSVPFYYLVINGSVPYSLSTAGNFSCDFMETKLKWLEYGAIPYFVLTHDSSEKMVGTAAENMFSTRYEDKKQQVDETLREFVDVQKKIGNARITAHNEVGTQLFKTDYSNGISVYTNYRNEAATVDGDQIEARSYLLK
ncbi:MAG: DUF5696 domain-containing protein, partial [Oscillospiraceae bacterium]